MKLKVRSVGPNDYGYFRCVAKNSLGETDGLIKLEELIAPTTVKTTEHYMENGRKPKDSQMVGDYGVEEWRDGGTYFFLPQFL